MIVGEKAGLECKTMTARNNIDLDGGNVPPQYYAQCQHYMLCTGLPVWYIAIKRDNAELYVLKIERDDDYITAMLKEEISFWESVQKKEPPLIDGSYSTQQTINVLYPAENAEDTKDDPVPIPETISEALDAVKGIDEQIKALEVLKNARISTIKEWMGNNTVAIGNTYKLTWSVVSGRKTIDTKALEKDHPDIYEKYLKKGDGYRMFKYKEVKA